MSAQPNVFDLAPALPEGFRYLPDLIGHDEEHGLVEQLQELPYQCFRFHGFVGNRRVVSYGWRYDFEGSGLQPAEELPAFIQPLRAAAAKFAHVEPEALVHALITEYGPGAAIGWHYDRPVFGDVVGVSLLSECRFRLRHRGDKAWERATVVAAPRSGYLLSGPARTEWEHSICPVDELRYSITFRTMR